jgi:hypothetical protein
MDYRSVTTSRVSLIVHEVHRPDLVWRRCQRAIILQLGFDPALGRFVAQLQALLAVEAADTFDVDRPSFTLEKHVDAIPVTHAGLGDLLDPFDEGSLPGPLRTVVIGRSVTGTARQVRRMPTCQATRT